MAELEGGKHSGEDENNEFRQAFFSRKLTVYLTTDVESYPALWMTCAMFTKVQRATALNAMSLKFSLNEHSVKKVLHSLRYFADT